MKFLWEGTIRNVLLRAENKYKIPLHGTDKKCYVEGLKVRMKYPSQGTDKKCNLEGLKVRMKFLCE
jgi:hypothetical protein